MTRKIQKEEIQITVPERLLGKVIWTVPPKFKQKHPGRFELDNCSQKELQYLKAKGLLEE